MKIVSPSDAAGMANEYTPRPHVGRGPAADAVSGPASHDSAQAEVEAVGRHSQPEEIEVRLSALPKEVGVLLVTIGAMGLVLPGLVGTPALLAGGLMLWPRGFRSVNGWLQRKCPKIHGHGAAQLIRYLDDLERRYPTSIRRGR